MSKRWKMKQRGDIANHEPTAVPAFKNPPEMDAAWLAQFTPFDETKLTANQLRVAAEFRKQFPGAKVGTRDTRISLYLIDPEMGPIAADLPRE